MQAKKKILVDARHVNKVIDGLGRYIIEVINGLGDLEIPEITILHTGDFPFDAIKRPEIFKFYRVDVKGGHPSQHIKLPGIIRKLKADVYFYPFIDPPLFSPAKTNIFAVHDLNHFFFSRYAATESNLAILMAKFFIYTSAIRYQSVIVFSDYVKNQLNRFVPASKSKTSVIYHGFTSLEQPGSVSRADFQLPKERYILYVGNNRPHKNLERLFEAYLILLKKYPDIMLVIAGNQISRFFNIRDHVEKNGLTKRVMIYSRPSNIELSALYKNSLFVVYPSLSEGFGFPLLEAWASGVAILTSNVTCLPEVGGNAAIFFNPLDAADIARAMDELLMNEPLRQDLMERGRQRLKLYTWSKSALSHLNLFLRA